MLGQTTEYRDVQTGLRIDSRPTRTMPGSSSAGGSGRTGRHSCAPTSVPTLLVVYDISLDVVVPDDPDRENEIRQNLKSETGRIRL